MSLSSIFSDGDRFFTLLEGEAVLAEITEDILDVQFPDSRRGLSKSRNSVNNRMAKFVQRCKVNGMRAVDVAEMDGWKSLGMKAGMLRTDLDKSKDAIMGLDKIW